jgi:hypothetical protein
MIRRGSVLVTRPDEQKIGFYIQEYMEEFGSEQGRLLYTEFESIISRDLRRKSVRVDSCMQVYVAIWRVLGTSWTEHIGSLSRARDGSPPECKRPFCFMLFLICS